VGVVHEEEDINCYKDDDFTARNFYTMLRAVVDHFGRHVVATVLHKIYQQVAMSAPC